MQEYLIYLRFLLAKDSVIVDPLPWSYGCMNFERERRALEDLTDKVAEVISSDLSVIEIEINCLRLRLSAIKARAVRDYRLLAEPTLPNLLPNCVDLIRLDGATKLARKRASRVSPVFSTRRSVCLRVSSIIGLVNDRL